jgi:hypothetical protein
MSAHKNIPSSSQQHDDQADFTLAVDEYSPSGPELDLNGTFEDFEHWNSICPFLSRLVVLVKFSGAPLL